MSKAIEAAEWVSPHHPDKMCDRIADAILDHFLKIDPKARCAVEVLGGHGMVKVLGEVSIIGEGYVGGLQIEQDIRNIVRTLTEGEIEQVSIHIVKQSQEIATGVDLGGAGDQGIMVGYACRDNVAKIPQEQYLSRCLGWTLFGLFPNDGKTQVTLRDGKIHSVVASFCRAPKKELEEAIKKWLDPEFSDVVTHDMIGETEPAIYANPAGDWNTGGFDADTGLTGRKIVVDAYGPNIPVGGGAFSGKDATKVDRSGAYMARKLAVTLLDRFDLEMCEVSLAYAIGKAEPVMAVFQGAGEEAGFISGEVKDYLDVDLTPAGIIEKLKLREPQFEKVTTIGHFGNEWPWDQPFDEKHYVQPPAKIKVRKKAKAKSAPADES